jgi:methyl coenzyme M reductase subunit C
MRPDSFDVDKVEDIIHCVIVEHMFELNDQITRNSIAYAVSRQILNHCSIPTIVICDETNNPPDVIECGDVIVTLTNPQQTLTFRFCAAPVKFTTLNKIFVDMDKK